MVRGRSGGSSACPHNTGQRQGRSARGYPAGKCCPAGPSHCPPPWTSELHLLGFSALTHCPRWAVSREMAHGSPRELGLRVKAPWGRRAAGWGLQRLRHSCAQLTWDNGGSCPSLKPLPPPELGEMGPTHLPIEHVEVRPSLRPPSTQSVPVLCCTPGQLGLRCPQSLSWGGGPADGSHWKLADLEGPVPPWPLKSRTRTELVLLRGCSEGSDRPRKSPDSAGARLQELGSGAT